MCFFFFFLNCSMQESEVSGKRRVKRREASFSMIFIISSFSLIQIPSLHLISKRFIGFDCADLLIQGKGWCGSGVLNSMDLHIHEHAEILSGFFYAFGHSSHAALCLLISSWGFALPLSLTESLVFCVPYFPHF